MVRDISSLIYLSGADAAPYSPMIDGSASVRSVIMIQTVLNARTGIPRNVTKGYPMGWQKPKYFYSPVYTTSISQSFPIGSDKRSTIYWNPNVKIWRNKTEQISFDTSDGNADRTVIMEGISAKGDFIFKRVLIKNKR